LHISKTTNNAVGAFPIAIILPSILSFSIFIAVMDLVSPVFLASSATSLSETIQIASDPVLFKAGLFIPVLSMFTSVIIKAPFFNASIPLLIASG
jgi:hypothetical protein